MRRMKDSGIAWIGEIPEHWKCCQIKYFGDIVGGTGFPLEYQGHTEEIYPFYKVSDLELSSDGKFLTTPNNSISEEIAKLINAKIVRKKSIVYAKIGAALLLNRRRIIIKDSIIDNNMSAFTPISGINLNWCFYLFTVIDFSIFIYPGTVPSFSEGAQSRIKVPVPPKDTQDKISDYLDAKCAEIDRSMELVRQSMDKLKAYKMSVITEAVTKGLDSDVPMKDSGVPWIGEMPIKWRIVPLKKQLINIVDYRGKTPEKVSSGVFLVTAKNIKNGKIDYSLSQEYVDENEYYSIMSRGLPKNGDLLFTTEAPLGEVAIVDREDIALAQRIIKFTVNTFILNNLFLKYWITSSGFQFFLHTLSTGSTAEGIKSSKISMLPLVLPSLPEQHRIASYLDTKCAEIDAIIVQKQALLDKLAAYRKSLIFECVTGKREVAA